MQFVVVGVMAQNLQDLENNPTFKGITIGMPVSELGSKVRYVTSDNGFNVYLITDSYYLSVFNVKMTKARVLARNGKVYGIEVVKEIKAPKDELIVFSTDEIDIIETESQNTIFINVFHLLLGFILITVFFTIIFSLQSLSRNKRMAKKRKNKLRRTILHGNHWDIHRF